jgi:hypothetical protein
MSRQLGTLVLSTGKTVRLTWTGASFMSSSLTFSIGSLLAEGVMVVSVFLKPSGMTGGGQVRDGFEEGLGRGQVGDSRSLTEESWGSIALPAAILR